MSLIKKAKSNPEAFVELYDRYVQRIYQYLLRRLQNQEESEDLCSAVWEKVLIKIHTLKSNEDEGFVAWLFAITRNELNQFYKNKKKSTSEVLMDIFEDKAKKPDELVVQISEAKMIQSSLLALPPQQRETVELKYFGDLRNKEIALIFEVSEKTVASNLSRALQTLKQNLEKLQ